MSLFSEIYLHNKNKKQIAIYFENHKITYEKFFSNVKKMISYFKSLGLKENDVVTISLPNIPLNIYSFYALNEMGVIQNIIHPLTSIDNIIKTMKETSSKFALILLTHYTENYDLLNDSKEKFIFVHPLFDNSFLKRKLFFLKYKNVRKNNYFYSLTDYLSFPEDRSNYLYDELKTSIYLHSGGTTGTPKIIELSNYAINNLANKVPYIIEGSIENKSMLAVLPLFHGFGLGMGVHAPLVNNASINLMMKFVTREVIKQINKNRLHLMIGVPLLYQKLMKDELFSKAKLANLEFCFVGGDNVQTSLINEFNQLMKKNNSSCLMFEGYGLTETVTVCSVNTKSNYHISSVGKGLLDIDIMILDEKMNVLKDNEIGEVFISSNTIMNGYYGDKKLSNEVIVKFDNKKWIKTGDLGYLNKGFLYLKGRKKRMFKMSGMNIYPLEVEKLALQNEDVFDASMEYFDNTKPHTILFIILNRNTTKNKKEIISDLYKLLNEKLIKYSVPTYITVLDEFPKTRIGKIDHNGFSDIHE